MLITMAVVAIPLFALSDRAHFDAIYRNMYEARDIEDLLEYSPMTRNAWIEALETNLKFQKTLKEKIAELEARKQTADE